MGEPVDLEPVFKSIIDDETQQKVFLVFGDEDISDALFWFLMNEVGNDLKFIPESLIKGGEEDYPLYNIKDAKYLVIKGLSRYDDIKESFVKQLTGGDEMYDHVSHTLICPPRPKIIIFCDEEPFDYLGSFTTNDLAWLYRIRSVDNGYMC